MNIIVESRSAGKLYHTERVHIAAVLRAAGHKVFRYEVAPTGRLVWVFPLADPDNGKTVHDTIRDYNNNVLQVDAKTFVDAWMEFRDMTRNKEFVRGTKAETQANGTGSSTS